MATIKDCAAMPERLCGGHRLCGGCGASVAVRQVLMGAGDNPVVASSATGCLEVSTTIYPYSSWTGSFVHTAFASSAATMSGVEAAFKGLKAAGKIPADKDIKFVAFGGDGGTYDIGLQSLSGAMERGHNMVYVCYDNGAYMNTGIQRSSATPLGAWATTAEVGKAQQGKIQARKDLTSIMADHHIPYVAQANIGYWRDLVAKAEKAFAADGPAFINVMSPCPRGWRTDPSQTVELARLATKTGMWPLFEVDNGVWKMTQNPKERLPVEDFLKPQGRFKHLFKPGNPELLAKIQQQTDEYYEYVERRCKSFE